jgi:tRNA(His) guanylyltransferase
MFDPLGDRIKSYEKAAYAQTVKQPLVVRLDGKNFHSLTSGLDKPFDQSFCNLMDEVAIQLINFTNADFVYTQSDEITLGFFNNKEGDILFGGKIQKMTSVLASKATLEFNGRQERRYENIGLGLFDARAFYVPSINEVINSYVWRLQDGRRNSILSYSMHVFGKKQIHGWTTGACLDALCENETPWSSLSERFKYGSFYKFVTSEREFTTDELSSLPEKHEARTNPNLKVKVRTLQSFSPPQTFSEAKELLNV